MPKENVPESIHEVEDDFLEDDGDPFWIIQRLVWSGIKTVLLAGTLIGLFWTVWGNGIFHWPILPKSWSSLWNVSTQNVKIKIESELPTVENKIIKLVVKNSEKLVSTAPLVHNLQSVNPENLSWSASKWNRTLWQSQQIEKKRNLLSTAAIWLRDTENFLSIPPEKMLPGKNPAERDQKITELLQFIETLKGRSQNIDQLLREEIAIFKQQSSSQNPRIINADDRILKEINRLKGEELDIFLREKIEAENEQFSANTQVWARESLRQKIASYQLPLSNLALNIQTNRLALIHDIRVVEFPNDPFQRVKAP